jgi:NADPH2:quinone reductase
MRSVRCEEIGRLEDLVIGEGPEPEVRPDGVVVQVEAAGVNYVDALFVQGRYQIKPPVPFVPGSEIAGRILAVGSEVTGWSPGDRVMAMCGLGGFAEQVGLRPSSLVRVPDAIDSAQAAGFIQSYCTALFALSRRARVAAGESVVVLGAGGGVGLAAIDVATAHGARAIGAASSPAKREAALAAGAGAVIDYTTEDLKARIRELTGGGADVVFDPVGGDHAEAALRGLGRFGRYVVIGFAGGGIPSLPLNQVLLNNRSILGVDWGAWTGIDPAGQQALLAELVGMVEAGSLHPAAPEVRPLGAAVDALADLLERRVTGKVVLAP